MEEKVDHVICENLSDDVMLHILKFIPLLELFDQHKISHEWHMKVRKAVRLSSAYHFPMLMSAEKTKRILQFLQMECRKLKQIRFNSKGEDKIIEFLERSSTLENVQVHAEFTQEEDDKILLAIMKSANHLKVLGLDAMSGWGWDVIEPTLLKLFETCKYLEIVRLYAQTADTNQLSKILNPLFSHNNLKSLELYSIESPRMERQYDFERFDQCVSLKRLAFEVSLGNEDQIYSHLCNLKRLFPNLCKVYVDLMVAHNMTLHEDPWVVPVHYVEEFPFTIEPRIIRKSTPRYIRHLHTS